MQFKVCKCFTIQGQAYEPEGGTNAEALNVFEGSPNHVSTLKAGGYICEMEEGIGYVSDPDKSLASGLVEDTVDGYSEQGVSDGSQLDAEGDPIPAGNKITTFYDATGAVVNSRDDEKTQGSTTTPSADGIGQVITTSDNETTFVCDKQFKGLRDNGDGTKTEIFVDQAGVESTGLTLAEPTQSGEPQLGVVDADGNTTYVDADGVTQTVAATDVNQDPVDPSQAVWNMVDGSGTYLGSKPCNDQTVMSQNADGVVDPVDSASGNQSVVITDGGSNMVGADGRTIRPLLDCEDNPIDVADDRFTSINTMLAAGDGFYTDLAVLGYANPDAVAGDSDYCVPNKPVCPELPRLAVDREARVARCWVGNQWSSPLPFAGRERIYFEQTQSAEVYDDTTIQGWQGAGWVELSAQSVEFTNENCYPVWCSSVYEANFLYRGDAGSRAEFRRTDASTPADDYTYKSLLTTGFDTRRFNAGTSDTKSILKREQRTKVGPGEKVTLSEVTEIRMLNYEASASNTISLSSWSLCIECEPCPE